MEAITQFWVTRIPLQRRISCQQSVILFRCLDAVHSYTTSMCLAVALQTSINYLNLFSGGKERFLLRAMTDDADEIKFDQRRDVHMLLR